MATEKATSIEVSKGLDFAFLLYPESAPADWRLKLELLGVPIAISPLHDKDLKKDKTGYKKEHYHCLYRANNNVTADSVRKKLQRCLGREALSKVQQIETNMENAYLYLTHESKDAIAKKKHVYDKKDIIHLNNFDIERYIVIDTETKAEVLKVLLQLIRLNGIPNIIDLHEFVEANGEAYGINERLFFSTIENKSSILRLYFDGAYQRTQREIAKEKARREAEEE